MLGDVGRLDNVAALGEHIVRQIGTSQFTRSRWRGGTRWYFDRKWDRKIAYTPPTRCRRSRWMSPRWCRTPSPAAAAMSLTAGRPAGGWRDRGQRRRDGRNPPQVHHRGAGDRLRSARAGSWRRQHREQRQRQCADARPHRPGGHRCPATQPVPQQPGRQRLPGRDRSALRQLPQLAQLRLHAVAAGLRPDHRAQAPGRRILRTEAGARSDRPAHRPPFPGRLRRRRSAVPRAAERGQHLRPGLEPAPRRG